MTACRAPRWSPTRENPGGDCLAPDVRFAVRLGDTGRHLPVCDPHAARYTPSAVVPIGEIDEP